MPPTARDCTSYVAPGVRSPIKTLRAFVKTQAFFQSPEPTRVRTSKERALAIGVIPIINCVLAKLSMFVMAGLPNGRRVRSVLFTSKPEARRISNPRIACTPPRRATIPRAYRAPRLEESAGDSDEG